jgi:hypothetical protein
LTREVWLQAHAPASSFLEWPCNPGWGCILERSVQLQPDRRLEDAKVKTRCRRKRCCKHLDRSLWEAEAWAGWEEEDLSESKVLWG